MERKAFLKATLPAFAVHVFTASGAAIALVALIAASERRWTFMFALLGVALLIDGIDGALARHFQVRDVLPRWSGDVLDLVVDILTYVFVPAYVLAVSDILPQLLRLPLAIVVVMTSVIYFADRKMKSEDNYFLGFPGVWNIVVFYLFLLQLNAYVAAGAVIMLAVATFVPLPFIHPWRVREFALANNVILGFGAVLAIVALGFDLRPAAWVIAGLCIVLAYFVTVGLLRSGTIWDRQ